MLFLGKTLTWGKPVRIGIDELTRHTYMVGSSGTGKSTLLETMILQNILKGEGVCFVDPHGSSGLIFTPHMAFTGSAHQRKTLPSYNESFITSLSRAVPPRSPKRAASWISSISSVIS